MRSVFKLSLLVLLVTAALYSGMYFMRPGSKVFASSYEFNKQISGLCESMRLVDGKLRLAFAIKLREDLNAANRSQDLTDKNRACAFEAQRVTGIQ